MLGKSNAPAPHFENRKVFRVRSSRQESLMSSHGIGLQSQALINIKDSNKDERERTVIRKFKFEEPRLEQIQDLESDLMKFFREDFHRRPLSSDFKKQVDGIEMLQKALPSSRKEIIEVLDILLRWFVLRFCESNTACILKDAMEKAIKNKVPKAVVPAVDVMFQALREFGSKVIPPKRTLKMLPELFDHQDQNVQACSKGLTLELCRWVGKDPVKSILFEKMRDTMKKELEAELVNVTGTAKPTRKIRSAQDKVLEQDAMPTTACSGLLKNPLLTKAAKWSERKDAVAELTKLASTKRIAPGDFSEICRTLKKVITDVNIAVAVEAIQAIGNLARGLRAHFSGSSRLLLPVLLEKLKEKKPALTEALTQTLQAMHKSGCINFSNIVEDIKAATKNKVPLVGSLTLNWLTVCIETSSKAIILKAHKEYVPICMECLSDGTPEVRDAAFSALSAIAKLVGMRPLEKSIEKLDDVRRKKLSEMIAGASESDVAVPSSGAIVPSSTAADGSFVRRSATSMLNGKNAVQAAPINKKVVPAKPGAAKKRERRRAVETVQVCGC